MKAWPDTCRHRMGITNQGAVGIRQLSLKGDGGDISAVSQAPKSQKGGKKIVLKEFGLIKRQTVGGQNGGT